MTSESKLRTNQHAQTPQTASGMVTGVRVTKLGSAQVLNLEGHPCAGRKGPDVEAGEIAIWRGWWAGEACCDLRAPAIKITANSGHKLLRPFFQSSFVLPEVLIHLSRRQTQRCVTCANSQRKRPTPSQLANLQICASPRITLRSTMVLLH